MLRVRVGRRAAGAPRSVQSFGVRGDPRIGGGSDFGGDGGSRRPASAVCVVGLGDRGESDLVYRRRQARERRHREHLAADAADHDGDYRVVVRGRTPRPTTTRGHRRRVRRMPRRDLGARFRASRRPRERVLLPELPLHELLRRLREKGDDAVPVDRRHGELVPLRVVLLPPRRPPLRVARPRRSDPGPRLLDPLPISSRLLPHDMGLTVRHRLRSLRLHPPPARRLRPPRASRRHRRPLPEGRHRRRLRFHRPPPRHRRRRRRY
mmetsp:Transcript_27978/g.90217  ORF Transcript_27978/g.90217 Transcript_27978/m.90217 type:complete len:265 (+) Transcript_27978:195-989(+)